MIWKREVWRRKILFNPLFLWKCLYQVWAIAVFPVSWLITDFVCLLTCVLLFPLEDCSVFGNFVITFIWGIDSLMFLLKLFQIAKNITLSEQFKNTIGIVFIGNLDIPNTHMHDHGLVYGKYEMCPLEWIWGREHFL